MTDQVLESAKGPGAHGASARAGVEIAVVFAAFYAGRWAAGEAGVPFSGPIGIVSAVVAATVMLHVGGSSWAQIGLRLPKSWKGWLGLVLIMAGIVAAVGLTVNFVFPQIVEYLGIAPKEGGSDSFEQIRSSLLAFIAFMVLVVWGTAAIGEELMYRGFLQTRLETVFGGGALAIALAVLIQAALFGIAHSYQGTYGIIMTGLIGFVMGIGYLVGRRWLLPLILVHGLIDTMSLVPYYLAGNGPA